MARTKKTIPIDLNVTTGTDQEPEERQLGQLFGLPDDLVETHARTRIYREEPIDEGHLGNMPSDADEAAIARRFGGGTFAVQAINEKGKILAHRTIKLAGEPRFESPIAKKRYERWLKEAFGEAAGPAPTAPTGDLVALEEARHNREIARIKAEAERDVAKAKAEIEARDSADERRRQKERQERIEEREREREERRLEREARMDFERQQAEANREARRLELEARGDPMQQFAMMFQLVSAMQPQGGGGPEDPVTAAIMQGPEILRQIRETGMAMDSQKAGAKIKKPENKRDVTLQGEIADKARAAIVAVQKRGQNPEAVLTRLFDGISQAAKQQPVKRPPGRPPQAKNANGAGKSLPARVRKVLPKPVTPTEPKAQA